MLNIKQIVKNKLKRNKLKRRYIDPRLGVEGFFKALEKDGIRYCVLRWFETLPSVQENEDIDILVADDDIPRIERYLLGTRKRGTPCDLYSSGGLPGTSYRGLAYYPEYLALEILDNTVTINNGIRVPSGRYHFLSMAFHAVYHKGYSSGVPSVTGKSIDPREAEHDYPEVLTSIAENAGIDLPDLTLEGLDDLLGRKGWRPSMDMLEKLSARNEWIRDTYFSRKLEDDPALDGFAVFIVRDRGMDFLSFIRTYLEKSGFDILYEGPISGDQRQESKRILRGGNWNKGPWPASGGAPAYLFAVHDFFPVKPSDELLQKHQGLVNERLLYVKVKIRDAVNKKLPRSKRCNVLHSSDNPRQGMEYLRVAAGDSGVEKEIVKKLKVLNSISRPEYPVLHVFEGHQRRARVELVDFKGITAVCKTYRPGRERFLENELAARKAGGELPEMTPVLETGNNYMIIPYYDDILDRERLLSVNILLRTREIISFFRDRGYELIDFKPKNIIMDSKEGMKIIDFEFMQKTPVPNSGFRGNYCWYAVPDDFDGDIPVSRQGQKKNYYKYWFSYTGIPLFALEREVPVRILSALQYAGAVYLGVRKWMGALKKGLRRMLKRLKRILLRTARKLIL